MAGRQNTRSKAEMTEPATPATAPATDDQKGDPPVATSTVSTDRQVEKLTGRVEEIERRLGIRHLTPEDQETADAELLTRLPTNYQEAVAQEAARERLAARDAEATGEDANG